MTDHTMQGLDHVTDHVTYRLGHVTRLVPCRTCSAPRCDRGGGRRRGSGLGVVSLAWGSKGTETPAHISRSPVRKKFRQKIKLRRWQGRGNGKAYI